MELYVIKKIIIAIICVVLCAGGYGAAAFIFSPEPIFLGDSSDNTPVITVASSCISCVEDDLKDIRGLKHIMVGYTDNRLDLRSDVVTGEKKALQIFFQPNEHPTDELIAIFTDFVSHQSPKERLKWRRQSGYDLVFFTENNEQSRFIKKTIAASNAILEPRKAITFDVRAADTFLLADFKEQKFFNSHQSLEDIQAAQREGRPAFTPGLSKLQTLKQSKDSIYNLNSSK